MTPPTRCNHLLHHVLIVMTHLKQSTGFHSVSFLDKCGETIEVSEADSLGSIILKATSKVKDCVVTIDSKDADRKIELRFIVHPIY